MTNFEKMKELITIDKFEKNANKLCDYIHELREEKSCYKRKCDECYKWLAEEYKPQILDDVEREYLSAVIKPFRDKIKTIFKCGNDDWERIYIHGRNVINGFSLPIFEKGTMYKNMKLNKHYNLEELGL